MTSRTAFFLAAFMPLFGWAENRPTWRGPRLDGTSIETAFPTTWSASEHIRWRTELPGSGHASPIVWEDRIFTVAAQMLLPAADAPQGGRRRGYAPDTFKVLIYGP